MLALAVTLACMLAVLSSALDTKHIEALVAPPFQLERHTVRSDGYLLALFRLSPPGSAPPTRRVPVLLHHGFGFSANVWFVLPRDQGLPYILYDAGYDVWALSERGTTHSLRHETLSPLHREFWRFTMDDLALRDLPAFLDYVLGTTGASSLATGSTQTFMLGAGQPNSSAATRVCHHVALTPVFFPQRISQPLLLRVLLTSGIDRAILHLDAQLVPPGLTAGLLGPTCAAQLMDARPFKQAAAEAACEHALVSTYGAPSLTSQEALTRLSSLTWPSTFAAGVPAQYAQAVRRGGYDTPLLAKFDYGSVCGVPLWGAACNQRVYGARQPPLYDLSQYRIPATIVSGGADLVSVPWDVSNVLLRLPPGVLRSTVNLTGHAHLDVVAYDARAYSASVIQALQSSCSASA
ncbi:hypothetical protein GPECTOR_99g808 [Gonium pectorale]|uniref:Partial AB-hydrolase lipase domain-containing protein n=1 Tax=Gonium pectorale TaxID=33097 RepID=A0A150FZW9_GONPE|nr:hypothetical protein GPECTOR_99g808 [Gonium pectorale]|eukprot:KXZ43173.1 hypothetical protein GPECTOR_99g808 [Gonium pectorale]